MNEKQWKEIIKKEGCAFKPLWKVRGEYANLAIYMRVYVSLLAKKEVFEKLEKLMDFPKLLEELERKELFGFPRGNKENGR